WKRESRARRRPSRAPPATPNSPSSQTSCVGASPTSTAVVAALRWWLDH
ncbi:MAG: hypothetical protein AVDCRST_MAG12-2563, partial [uncultured Rubrobacteraceae bacterium]